MTKGGTYLQSSHSFIGFSERNLLDFHQQTHQSKWVMMVTKMNVDLYMNNITWYMLYYGSSKCYPFIFIFIYLFWVRRLGYGPEMHIRPLSRWAMAQDRRDPTSSLAIPALVLNHGGRWSSTRQTLRKTAVFQLANKKRRKNDIILNHCSISCLISLLYNIVSGLLKESNSSLL